MLIHPDYSRRRLGRAGDASGEGRGVVPPTAWLLEVAQRHGLKEVLTSGGRENFVEKERQEAAARGRPFQSGKAFCSAIVKVVGSKESSGLLTQWTAEERHFAAELGDMDADSVCSLRVVEALRFQSSLALDAPLRFHQDLWSSDPLTWQELGRACGLSREDFARALRTRVEAIDAFCAAPLCLRVPLVPFLLLLKRDWSALLLQASLFFKRGPYLEQARKLQKDLNFPSDQWVQAQKILSDQLAAAGAAGNRHRVEPGRRQSLKPSFSGEGALDLSTFLRSWAPTILEAAGASGPEEKLEAHLKLEGYLQRLDAMQKQSEAEWQEAHGYKKQRIGSVCLARSVLQCICEIGQSWWKPFRGP